MMLRYLFGCLISLMVCTATPSWAAITYVGGQTGAMAQTTPLTVTFSLTGGSDATPQADDLVIATYCTSSAADLTLIIDGAGGVDYTQFGTETYVNDTYDTNERTAYRVMPGTPDSDLVLSETVTGGTGNVSHAGTYVIQVFRGVHATPLEQAVQQGAGIDTMIVNPGGITPTTSGTVVYVAGCGSISTGGVYTSSDLTAFLTSTGANNNDSNIGAGYFAWTSGAFNPATFGGGGTDTTSGSYAWKIVALAPAAEVAGGSGSLMLMGIGR